MDLSIIIPVYNVEAYLVDCLESCIKQVNNENIEYEIICINDGSTDRSLDILKTYERNYTNIKVISQSNSGVSVARNIGLEEAIGEYVWFVDSDDLISSYSVSKIKQKSLSQPDVLRFGFHSFEDEISTSEKLEIESGKIIPFQPCVGAVVWTNLYRRSFLIDNVLLFVKNIISAEDLLFNYEVSKNKPRIETITDVLYFYRRNSASITRTNNKDKIDRTHFEVFSYIYNKYYNGNSNYTESEIRGLLEFLCMTNVRNLIVGVRTLKYNKQFPIKKQIIPPKTHMRAYSGGLKQKIMGFITYNTTNYCGLLTYYIISRLRQQRRKNSDITKYRKWRKTNVL